jgi:short-subunit dehydrogenase
MREVYKNMESVKRGTIINVLSTVCNFSNEGIGAYTASKASLDALAKVFRKEARLSNVKVCSIYPGGVNTSFRETTKPEYLEVESVVQAICTMILTDSNTSIDELVIRPMIEKNYIYL